MNSITITLKGFYGCLLGVSALAAYSADIYKGQFKQDQYVFEHFFKAHNKPGTFVDIGAHDGQTYSNTYFFEKNLRWTGICFEPLPHLFNKLVKTRNCICVNACVSDSAGIVSFMHIDGCDEMLSGMSSTYDRRQFSVVLNDLQRFGGSCKTLQLPAVRLDSELKKNNMPAIDFLSIDTEGSELIILQTIDFEAIAISVITVENNYNESAIKQLLEPKGYRFVTRLGVDDIYYKPSLINFID